MSSNSMNPPQNGTRAERKRSQAACVRCRRIKKKCDAVRPTCKHCQSSGSTCVYETNDASETRLGALRRQNKGLQDQLERITKSLENIRSLAEQDVSKCVQLLQWTEDPIEAFQVLDESTERSQQQQQNWPEFTPSGKSSTMTEFPAGSILELELMLQHPEAYPLLDEGSLSRRLESLAGQSLKELGITI